MDYLLIRRRFAGVDTHLSPIPIPFIKGEAAALSLHPTSIKGWSVVESPQPLMRGESRLSSPLPLQPGWQANKPYLFRLEGLHSPLNEYSPVSLPSSET